MVNIVDEMTKRTLPRVLLTLIATLLLAFVIGYIGVSGFGGEPIGIEKASAYPGPYVEDIAETAWQDSNRFWHSFFVDSGYADRWGPANLYWVYDEPVNIPCGNEVLYPEQGPVYCGMDWGIYYQVDFLAKEYGDGAVAAVVAHEMGHHVQNLLGSHKRYTVQNELEADCFAGVYMASAYWDGMLDKGDVNEAYEMFGAMGDELDVYHDAHHGTSQERQEWFERGWNTEDPTQCGVALS